MQFAELARYFERIEKETSRLAITSVLSDLFIHLSPPEVRLTAYLLMGRVAPQYDALEFGMAEKTVVKSVLSALHVEKNYFQKELAKSGDVGITVEAFKKQYVSFEETDLSVTEVYNELMRMAQASGPGSQDLKVNILSALIRQLDGLSCRYVVRIPQAKLRLGFSDMTILDAYSWMLAGNKSLRATIERAYQVRPDLGFIGRALKEKGVEALDAVGPSLFTPILMMRAERLSSGKEIIEQIGECAVEPKYDGFRIQLHFRKKTGEVRLYSRNLEDVSLMYPDIQEAARREIVADEVIMEGEAIGFDPATGAFLPFQETVQRKRKYDIEAKAKEIPLKLFTFELLYADGVNFIRQPFEKRRERLSACVLPNGMERTIVVAPNEIIGEETRLDQSFESAISRGLEGIIAKKKDGIYQPGARGWNWIKFKRSYSSKITDTIDCLVMGYDTGKGKRSGFGIGAFLAGVYDPEKDMFVTVAKIGTGLTDEEWKTIRAKCERVRSDEVPAMYDADKMMGVDQWVTPAIVVEIKADEITRSPVHTAGRVMKLSKSGTAQEVGEPGYALRFPRLVRFRDDKRPEDATTVSEVMTMFSVQKTAGSGPDEPGAS